MIKKKTTWARICDGDVGFTTSGKSETFLVKGNTTVTYGKESKLQILYTNDSLLDQELRDYQTMQTNYAQLSIVNKIKLPLMIEKRSTYMLEITIKGRYLGESNENVEFVFKNGVQKVNIPIVVTDERLKWLHDAQGGSKTSVGVRRLRELIYNPGVPGVRQKSNIKYKNRSPLINGTWDIPSELWDWYEDKKSQTFPFPVAFDDLTYQNYQDKFHALLHLNELKVTVSLQTFAQEWVHFTKHDQYLVLKIPNLSRRRPTLIPNDGVVAMCPSGDKRHRYQGFIHEVLENEIRLMFNSEFHHDYHHRVYNVIFFNNRLSFIKQHEIIKRFLKNSLSEEFLFPKCPLKYQPPRLEIRNKTEFDIMSAKKMKRKKKNQSPKVVENIEWFHSDLNDEQKSAVINILKGEGRPMPYVIYGPPGTGKTITLTESIIQLHKQFPKNKLLICAPTNAGAHLLLSKLVKSRLFEKTVLKRLVSAYYYNSPFHNKEHDKYCIVSYQDLLKNDSNVTKGEDFHELKIIVTTVYTAGTLYMMGFERGDFSHIFIDEAGQAMEPETLFPLSFLDKGNQVILAGDPKQLHPVVISKLAEENGLGKSMLDRFINSFEPYKRDKKSFPKENGYNPKVITHLIRNYRSLPEIVEVFSSLFYDNMVKATVLPDIEKELNELNQNVHWDIGCRGPVIVHGVKGDECLEKGGTSFYNPHEALHVYLYFEKLVNSGISPDDIGIVTPYVSQVAQINLYLKRCYLGIKLPKVSSVELFQGQERMIIIISLVRSSGVVRFIASEERINVAMSRAKALVIVIGNPSIMSKDKNWEKILKKAKQKKNYVGNNPPS